MTISQSLSFQTSQKFLTLLVTPSFLKFFLHLASAISHSPTTSVHHRILSLLTSEAIVPHSLPSSSLLTDTYPRTLKTYVYTKIWTWMLIGALFIMAKKWRQSTCPSTDEVISKTWYIHTILFSHKKGMNTNPCSNMDEPWKHHVKQKKPGTKAPTISFYLYEISRTDKFIET